MKLRFLGQSYVVSSERVENIASENTARFLGQRYTIRRPVKNFKPRLGIEKYRGINYDT